MKLKILLFSGTVALALGTFSTSADEVEHVGAPGVTLYSFSNYSGRNLVLNRDTPKLKKLGFSANTMSMKVVGGQWEVCDGNRYSGTCEVFAPGKYTFGLFNWGNKIKSVRRLRSGTPTITLFKGENMQGEHNTYVSSVERLKDFSSNSVVNSVRVGGGEWVLCENSAGKGNCETIRQDVRSLRSIGLKNTILSLYRATEWDNGLDGDPYGGGGGYSGGGGGYGGYGPGTRRNGGGDRRYAGGYPQIVLYEGYDFTGPRMTIDSEAADLRNSGFSNRASSVRVSAGVWELCDGAGFTKTCRVVIRDEGNLTSIGLDALITSVRPVSDGYGSGGGRREANTRGFEGQRTVFFAEPSYRGESVASCLYGNTQCGIAAANAFCRESDLGSAVYFDQASSYRPPYILGERRTATRAGQQRLIDVLCRR